MLGFNRDDQWVPDVVAFNGDEAGDGPSGPVANPLRGGNRGAVAYTVRTAQTGLNGHGIAADVAHTLDGASGQGLAIESAWGSVSPIGYTLRRDTRLHGRLALQGVDADDVALAVDHSHGNVDPVGFTLRSGHRRPGTVALQGPVARRLTPIECERLQGLPDDHTLVPYRGRLASDTPRYRAIGNGMAVPVLRFIGDGIARVEREGL